MAEVRGGLVGVLSGVCPGAGATGDRSLPNMERKLLYDNLFSGGGKIATIRGS